MRSLTGLLLRLTAFFAALALLAILLPALGRACQDWLSARLNGAHLAALALEAAGDEMLDPALQDELLTLAGVELVSLRVPGRSILPLARDGAEIRVGTTIDLRRLSLPRAMVLSLRLMVDPDASHVRVIGLSAQGDDTLVDLVMRRAPLVEALRSAASRIVLTGLVIATVAGALLFAALQVTLVQPMRVLTDRIRRFEEDPEAPLPAVTVPRNDEIGRAMGAVEAMQRSIQQDLWRKSRLAALGTAVAKINHDLRGVLATALLVSDRLAGSTDPKVRAAAPMLLGSIERAVALCTRTMEFAKEGPPTLAATEFPLRPLVEEGAAAARAAAGAEDRAASITIDIAPALSLSADRDLLFRVFLNLIRNALEAGARAVSVAAAEEGAAIAVTLADDGPGLPAALAADPFRPFHSSRRGGSGLGLTIARDLVRAHGGDIEVADTGPSGTRFRLLLPGIPGGDEPPAQEQGASGREE
jgi:signal transduction histidine kinase